MGTSVQPETLDQKIARLEAERSRPSLAPTKETLAEKIARLENATSSDVTANQGPRPNDPRDTRERLAGATANFMDAFLMGGLSELGGVSGNYRANQDIIDDARQYDPVGSGAARFAGTAAITALTMGANGIPYVASKIPAVAKALPFLARTSPEVTKVPMLRQMGNAAGVGAGIGALEDGSIGDRAKAAAWSGLLTSLFPVGAAGAGYIAKKIPGSTWAAGKISPALGARGQAAQELASMQAADAGRGFSNAVPRSSAFPHMLLDDAVPGGNVEALAQSVVGSPGAGRTAVTGALRNRMEQMRPSVTGSLERGTGMTLADAENVSLLAKAAHETHGASVEAAKGAHEVAVASAKAQNAGRNAKDAFVATAGPVDDGVVALQEAIADKNATANDFFNTARTQSNGAILDNPELEALRRTPLGKRAEAWAEQQMRNRGIEPPVAKQDAHFAGFSPEQTKAQIDLMQARGISVPDETLMDGEVIPLVNPEKLHLMKRWLSGAAKRPGLPMYGLTSSEAAEATSAVGLIDKAKGALPEAWQAADRATAEKWRIIDAQDLARRASTAVGEGGTNKAALTKSATAIEQGFAKMGEDERQAFLTQLRASLAERYGNLSPDQAAKMLSDASHPLRRMTDLATGGNAGQIVASLGKRELPALVEPAYPKELSLLNRGLKALETPVVARDVSGKSLAELEGALAESPDIVRPGIAAAVRGGWEGASNSIRSPGRFFMASPERTRQVALAFDRPTEASSFLSNVKSWDKVAQQGDRILGGSVTEPRAAFNRSRIEGEAVPTLVEGGIAAGTGRLGIAMHKGRSLLNRAINSNLLARNAELGPLLVADAPEAEIAGLLSSRAKWGRVGRRGLLGLAAGLADSGLADFRVR